MYININTVCIYCSGGQSLSCVQLFVTPWTVARQTPLSMGFPRHGYQSRSPFPPPGDLSNPGVEPRYPTLETGSLPPNQLHANIKLKV